MSYLWGVPLVTYFYSHQRRLQDPFFLNSDIFWQEQNDFFVLKGSEKIISNQAFFAVLLCVAFLCLKVIIKLSFHHIANGWVTPHRWKIRFRQLCWEAWFPLWKFCLCRGVFVWAVRVFVCVMEEFLFVPWEFLFLFLFSVFCDYHVRNCSTLVKGYYLDFYLQSSSFKELLLPPLYISSQMRPWKRIASTIHFPQSVWTKYGYSCLSALDIHSDTNIKIFMDVSSIPEPRLNQSSFFANRLSVLYLN